MVQYFPLLVLAGLISSGVLAETTSNESLQISALVENFGVTGLTLTVLCNSSTHGQPSVSGHVALTLSKISRTGGNVTSSVIASVNSFSDHVTSVDDFISSAKGAVDAEDGVSFLKVQFESLPWTHLGEFECLSTSISRFGRCLELKKSTNVSMADIDLDVFAKVLELKGGRNVVTDIKEQLDQCQVSLAQYKKGDREALQKKDIEEVRSKSSYWVSGVFNDSRIYTITDKDKECVSFGGHLVEINTEDEFLFLEKTIMQPSFGIPSGANFLVTGARYKTLTGPFEFEAHPEDTVYLGHWAGGEPDRNDLDYNWIILDEDRGKLYMHDGRYQSSTLKYLCEVPL